MTAPAHLAEPPKFKAPTSDSWCNLPVDTQSDPQKQGAANAAQDTLKEALLASLQMQHVVVLAGAGTSMAVGGPSMKDLWEAAIGKKPSEGAASTAKAINYDVNSQNNIEEFLS